MLRTTLAFFLLATVACGVPLLAMYMLAALAALLHTHAWRHGCESLLAANAAVLRTMWLRCPSGCDAVPSGLRCGATRAAVLQGLRYGATKAALPQGP